MSCCPFCLDVSPSITEGQLKVHITTKHNVSNRDDSEFKENTWTYKGKEFLILEQKSLQEHTYRCGLCTIDTPNVASMNLHLDQKHIIPWEEKTDARLWNRNEKQADKTYCSICWIEFPNIEGLNVHKTKHGHLTRSNYVKGTGCDLCCRIVELDSRNDFVTHNKRCSKYHTKVENYQPGSGCDICKRVHNAWDAVLHQKIESYQPGSGCDICCVKIVLHEESIKHKKIEKRKAYITKQHIAPKLTKKSARK